MYQALVLLSVAGGGTDAAVLGQDTGHRQVPSPVPHDSVAEDEPFMPPDVEVVTGPALGSNWRNCEIQDIDLLDFRQQFWIQHPRRVCSPALLHGRRQPNHHNLSTSLSTRRSSLLAHGGHAR
ncbi:uncharacterized protein B0H18DRAFT_557423 [Fomitopsis serialis]|uniref:uncharacterized protein n=1 Tax=Fomitopsis serialis TaxID=139415 RepID=UPI00200750FF|nr:uncharacterized protein B0H18DRAFT_557423 [Neoantrodia serialis]KAH9934378.1 hypothetical protein B0H18DRAFT_557423 [Neoantrodia serialis]